MSSKVLRSLVFVVCVAAVMGCTVSAQNTPIGNISWTIWDSSHGCVYDENGFPTGGPECHASGAITDAAMESIAKARAAEAASKAEAEIAKQERKAREAEAGWADEPEVEDVGQNTPAPEDAAGEPIEALEGAQDGEDPPVGPEAPPQASLGPQMAPDDEVHVYDPGDGWPPK